MNKSIFFGGTPQVYRIKKFFVEDNYFVCYEESKLNSKLQKVLEDLKNIYKSKVLYTTFYGIFGKRNILYLFFAKLLKKKIICHWIGTDVLFALKDPKKTNFLQKFIDLNLSGNELLKKELLSIGIDSKVEYIILNDIKNENIKNPKEHSVLVYLPDEKEKFYGEDFILKLAKDFSNIKFYIVANTNKNRYMEYKNIINLGKISLFEMQNLYSKISILIRLPEHDGLSLMLLEALGMGKEVFYNFEHPFCYYVNSYKTLKEKFSKVILENPKKNYEAIKYIENTYKSDIFFNNLKNYFKEFIGE